jgi:xylulokinase
MSSSVARPAFLGIDLGTSQLKALLVTRDGRILGRGRARYAVTVPAQGQAQTDPGHWWQAAGTAVREALAQAGADGADVQCLALAGQMHGVVLSDPAGAPLRPAIVWLDRRAAAEAAYYGTLPGALTGPLGNEPSPGMAGPILRWLARHEPATVAAARWALQPKDWLRLRLTGEAATDPTDASGTLLFDLARGTWATALVAALGVPEVLLPGIRDPARVAGHLLPAAAAHLGLPPGLPVATGAADTAAALFAAGLPGDAALLTLGTGGQWVVPAGPRPAPGVNVFRAIGGGCYHLAAVQNMGEAINWVRTMLGVSWEQAYSAAARPWRADTPVFLPYLTEERWDPSATGAWAGLTLGHDRDDLLRSALEGVAFLLRDRLADLRAAGHHPARVVLGGGGTRHPAWRQLLADVLGLPLYPASTTWLSATGAARLAAAAVSAGSSPAAPVPTPVALAEPIAPIAPPDAVAAAYARYLTLRRTAGSAGTAPGR